MLVLKMFCVKMMNRWWGRGSDRAKSVITSMTVGRCEEERLSLRVNHRQCQFPSHTSVSFPITLCHIQVSLQGKKRFGKRNESVRSESHYVLSMFCWIYSDFSKYFINYSKRETCVQYFIISMVLWVDFFFFELHSSGSSWKICWAVWLLRWWQKYTIQ